MFEQLRSDGLEKLLKPNEGFPQLLWERGALYHWILEINKNGIFEADLIDQLEECFWIRCEAEGGGNKTKFLKWQRSYKKRLLGMHLLIAPTTFGRETIHDYANYAFKLEDYLAMLMSCHAERTRVLQRLNQPEIFGISIIRHRKCCYMLKKECEKRGMPLWKNINDQLAEVLGNVD